MDRVREVLTYSGRSATTGMEHEEGLTPSNHRDRDRIDADQRAVCRSREKRGDQSFNEHDRVYDSESHSPSILCKTSSQCHCMWSLNFSSDGIELLSSPCPMHNTTLVLPRVLWHVDNVSMSHQEKHTSGHRVLSAVHVRFKSVES